MNKGTKSTIRHLIWLFLFFAVIRCFADDLQGPVFSVERGFYHTTFDVEVSSEIPGASIRYTLDGSDPRTSESAVNADVPVTVHIDAADIKGRYVAPGVVLRASVVVDDTTFSRVETHTYLFIDKIAELSPDGVRPGPAWPEQNTRGGGQQIDYGLDPAVLQDPRYRDNIIDAFLSIPCVSLVTDLEHLFDSRTGIYVNALRHGREWERPGSVELLYPDGSEGFQVNTGIRIRGGWSRHNDCPKHAFRLFFREEYGDAKLIYPLFGDEGVDEFDKLDLRTSMNYSWSYKDFNGAFNTMNRDVFSRDLQREMGQPYTRSRYYHLFLNGVYWGLFQSQERPEARFAASYFGGSSDEYDVVKVDVGESFSLYDIEATDGDLEAWEEVWNLNEAGFDGNENYFSLEGKDPDGTRNPDKKMLVDIDNLIDYMLIIFYTGNFDAPVSKFRQNKVPNNFFAIYNRNGADGFKFLAHDNEHTLLTTTVLWPCIGIEENRVNIADVDDGYKMVVPRFNKFHPQWLHYRLSDNADYRIRFADHVYRYMFNERVMTPETATRLFMSRAEEIEQAIIAESARWGDAKMAKPRTKDDDWLPTIDNIVDHFFPVRTDIVLNQLEAANLYPDIDPPLFFANGDECIVERIHVEPGFEIEIANPNSSGSIRYTVDNTDPRKSGGQVSATAVDGGTWTSVKVNGTTVLMARIIDDDKWSALHKVVLLIGDDLSALRITEIHYNPLDEGDFDGREFEFIELKNTGVDPLNLTMARFSRGIDFVFPEGTILASGEFVVLASNRVQFKNRYGFEPFGEYTGQLDNGGERIVLVDAGGDTVISIRYDDQNPWPTLPDTDGYSLVARGFDPTGEVNDPYNWKVSAEIHGSPGADDVASSVGSKIRKMPQKTELLQNYPNPFNASTKIRFVLSKDSRVILKVFDLLGREVDTLLDVRYVAGEHSVIWDAGDRAAGVYFYRLCAGDYNATKKFILVK